MDITSRLPTLFINAQRLSERTVFKARGNTVVSADRVVAGSQTSFC